MPESLRTRFMRLGYNLFPAYRGSGARVTYIADDFREVRIKLPLNWRTRNVNGTIYGGSMYAAVDPIHSVMLLKIFGDDFIVWDKAAAIRFRKPGRRTLHARFVLDEAEVDAIRSALADAPSVDRFYDVELVDADGVVHASIEKTVYIARRGADGTAPTRDDGRTQ